MSGLVDGRTHQSMVLGWMTLVWFALVERGRPILMLVVTSYKLKDDELVYKVPIFLYLKVLKRSSRSPS